jgi:hypothetical protein
MVISARIINQSLDRLQQTFEGDYGDSPILEDDRSIGSIRSDAERIYLTFRGSVDSLWEILTCFDLRKAFLASIGLSGRVHQGIFTAFGKIQPFIENQLRELEDRREIIVEGYSRGGAIATLMGAYLKAKFPQRQFQVLVYSPMRIFDQTAIDSAWLRALNIHNFICQEDLIPRLWAPSCLGFDHVPGQRTFSAERFPEYQRRVQNRTYLHFMSGFFAEIIKWIIPARIWEAHMPETYREGAASVA